MSWIKDFKLTVADLSFVGQDLSRPECVLAEKSGDLWISDNRHALTHLCPDGSVEKIGQSGETNGFTMDSQGNFIVADWMHNKVLKISRQGETSVILDAFEGKPLPPTNYVYCDSQDRLWIAISSRRQPWFDAAANPQPDGFVLLLEPGKAPRIVAEGITFTNEVRLDPAEKYLYVAETMASKISRFPIQSDGNLGSKETFGPESLGDTHQVDGFCLDAEGNVWVTTVLRNGLMVIDAQTREAHTVLEDPNEAGLQASKEALENGTMTPMHMMGCIGKTLLLVTSVNFGGPDLKTVYLGSLGMNRLASFQAPVAGAPMPHWNR
ncbi:MAG TPA: gluconolactonase [Microscillaceae bacterium]|jgi:sugar lactone lactonase YvrE|nr:gluconolactonase [Microscillaceae bacterium]